MAIMAVSEKSLKNLEKGKATQFSSTNPPQNPGRRPSVLRLIKENGLSIDDIRQIINDLIWEYPPEEIQAILKDKDNPIPMGVVLVLGALIDDQKKKGLNNFEKLMDRAHGKPTQTVDIKPTNLFTAMTPEERDKRIEELLKKSEPKKPVKKS
jgi:hypothetical protein